MEQQRTIAQVVRTYHDQLNNAVYDTLNGRIDAASMRRAHRDMIWRFGPDAYTEGLREGGVPAEELDSADRKAITDWINGQWAHVNGFADDTVAARGDDGKRKQILSRLDMWVESMRVIGNQGLMSAKKNKMGTWRLGGTIEHCTTCSGLHKKRHRLSWYTSRGLIPRQPGSQTLECKGYLCQCYITDDEGNVLVPATGRALRFDPNQPRDEEGKWTDTETSKSSESTIVNSPVGKVARSPVSFPDKQGKYFVRHKVYSSSIDSLSQDDLNDLNKFSLFSEDLITDEGAGEIDFVRDKAGRIQAFIQHNGAELWADESKGMGAATSILNDMKNRMEYLHLNHVTDIHSAKYWVAMGFTLKKGAIGGYDGDWYREDDLK